MLIFDLFGDRLINAAFCINIEYTLILQASMKYFKKSACPSSYENCMQFKF